MRVCERGGTAMRAAVGRPALKPGWGGSGFDRSMIHTFGIADGIASFRHYLAIGRVGHEGIRAYPDIAPLAYRDVLGRDRLPASRGAAIFTDIGGLNGASIAKLCRMIRALPGTVTVLNHPLFHKGRYELLRALHEAGVNRHNVYRPTEHRTPRAWPVFVRAERGHWMSPLLHDAGELKRCLEGMVREGAWLGDKLIVEFNDYRSPDGFYRKYSAFRFGDLIFGGYLLIGRNWYLRSTGKHCPDMLSDEARLAEEREHIRACGHVDQVRAVFDRAGIQYGRVDYGISDGRVQAFEINTAPMLLKAELLAPPQRMRRPSINLLSERIAEGFAALAEGAERRNAG
jgi:hypothetical protein